MGQTNLVLMPGKCFPTGQQHQRDIEQKAAVSEFYTTEHIVCNNELTKIDDKIIFSYV